MFELAFPFETIENGDNLNVVQSGVIQTLGHLKTNPFQ